MEPEAQKQEDNSTNSVVGVQPRNATDIESTEDSDSTTKTQIPQTSELSGEAKAVEPEEDCVIDAKRDGKAVEPEEDCVIDAQRDGQSSSSGGGGGESGRAEDSDSTPKTQIPQTSEPSGEEQEAKAVEPEEDCVIDVKSDEQSSSGGGESWRAEKVCRICHLSPENSSENSELIQLGCGCKAELGFSHLHCAETWFKHKGNRQCEICGSIAKNIPGMQDTRIFMVEWNQTRLTRSAADPSRNPCQCRNSTCNLLLACLVLAFILPWFFRIGL
ncbi:hypothetical protein RHSIM_Rhsim04G0075700 [Rhododendron simsii]|uniref:RING-CH-type domain-containing protein n=1 Tax=Rhododendron simsii TaxID=118357 RepID=A0A834LS44_RHOSS|nr:hypothetical protein RHSIM_Rhsim04G0075700 [Rhododendron simsii]